jgi:hypothetical protein
MKKTLTILLLFKSIFIFGQVKTGQNNFLIAKEFSKEIALYNSKSFLFTQVIGITNDITKFEIIPLAAANSGELTTLLYKCGEKQIEGLLLGFYGNYWNESGVVYQGFAFKNFNKEKSMEFLKKIDESLDNYEDYLKEDAGNNSICFKYDDIDVLIDCPNLHSNIRIFWNGFDSSWEKTAFDRSKRRFEKRIK